MWIYSNSWSELTLLNCVNNYICFKIKYVFRGCGDSGGVPILYMRICCYDGCTNNN